MKTSYYVTATIVLVVVIGGYFLMNFKRDSLAKDLASKIELSGQLVLNKIHQDSFWNEAGFGSIITICYSEIEKFYASQGDPVGELKKADERLIALGYERTTEPRTTSYTVDKVFEEELARNERYGFNMIYRNSKNDSRITLTSRMNWVGPHSISQSTELRNLQNVYKNKGMFVYGVTIPVSTSGGFWCSMYHRFHAGYVDW